MRPRARRRLAALTAALLCVGARAFAAANAHLAHGGKRLIYAPTRPAERDADLRFAPRVVAVDAIADARNAAGWWEQNTAATTGSAAHATADGVRRARDAIVAEGDVVYLLVRFDTPVHTPNGTPAPAIALRTGAHSELNANDSLAEFVGGGYGMSKSFWANDESSPLLTGMPVPCRAGGALDATIAAAGLEECAFGSEYSGTAAGLVGVGGNARREQAMDSTLAFRYIVGDSGGDERTRVLATAGRDALRLQGATLLAADVRDGSNGPAADVTLPAPGSPQALARRSSITVGAPYVTRVTARARRPRGKEGNAYDLGESVDVLVHFSEAVVVRGCQWVAWSSPSDALGNGDLSCLDVYIVLPTGPWTHNSTVGVLGDPELFPTAFLVQDEAARAANVQRALSLGLTPGEEHEQAQAIGDVLAFRYVVRRGDIASALKYADQDSLVLQGDATIERADRTRPPGDDNGAGASALGVQAGVRLPRPDAKESLAGHAAIAIDAEYGQY